MEEIEKTKKAIRVLKHLWEDLELLKGPKLHILFDHTIEQVELFGGIADLVKDFVEKYHQIGKKLDYLVARMSVQSFRQQEMVKIRRQWLATNPLVHNQIYKVTESRKHKNKTVILPCHQISKQLSKLKQEWKKIKREVTESNSHFDVF